MTDTQLSRFKQIPGKEHYGCCRLQEDLRMAEMTRFAARLPSLGGWLPTLAFGRWRICGWGSAGVGGVVVYARFERCQAFEEGEHYKPHTHRGLVPLFNWYLQPLWHGCGIKH